MKLAFRIVPILVLIVLFSACAGQSVRTSYVSMEKQFISLGQQYDIYYNANMVSAATHERMMVLWNAADIALDSYRIAILNEQPSDEFYMELNRLKTTLILELYKMSEEVKNE
jgi:hypothetical protein